MELGQNTAFISVEIARMAVIDAQISLPTTHPKVFQAIARR